jgi:hypothetical protein
MSTDWKQFEKDLSEMLAGYGATFPDEDGVNVYLDDKRDPADFDHFGEPRLSEEQRNDGIEWIWVKTVSEAKRLLETGIVKRLALDNDLGLLSDGDGRDLVNWLIDPDQGTWPEGPISVVSANPVARKYMLDTLERYAPESCSILRNPSKL